MPRERFPFRISLVKCRSRYPAKSRPEAHVKNLDLRPLSVGEILDRTFTLYRGNFLLFLGICAVPQILLLALNLSQVFIGTPAIPGKRGANAAVAQMSTGMGMTAVILGILGLIVWLIVYLFSQGATVTAVSELYIGRTITISDSFRRVRGEVGNLFGVIMLNGLATGAAFILLIIPGIYVMCRLAVCIPCCADRKSWSPDIAGAQLGADKR